MSGSGGRNPEDPPLWMPSDAFEPILGPKWFQEVIQPSKVIMDNGGTSYPTRHVQDAARRLEECLRQWGPSAAFLWLYGVVFYRNPFDGQVHCADGCFRLTVLREAVGDPLQLLLLEPPAWALRSAGDLGVWAHRLRRALNADKAPRCQLCGIFILKRTNNQKYCRDCAKVSLKKRKAQWQANARARGKKVHPRGVEAQRRDAAYSQDYHHILDLGESK